MGYEQTTFGYELDITKLSDEDKGMIPNQISLYKKYSDLIRNGDYWRIASFRENNEYDCWMSVSKDKNEALITFIQVFNHPNYKIRFLKISGLDDEKNYEISFPDEDKNQWKTVILSGKTIKNAGIAIKRDWGDFQGKLIYLKSIN